MKFKARAYRSRHKAGSMNKAEQSYSQHLELLKKSGEILDWAFEPEKLKIADNCQYCPDFRVLIRDKDAILTDSEYDLGIRHTIIEFHEVKALWKIKGKNGNPDTFKMHAECDSLVKIKACAELHPYKFIIVWKGLNGNWEKREIN